MSEDILESLWNFLQIIFKHHSKIHKLNKPYKQSSRFCPRKNRKHLFLEPNLEELELLNYWAKWPQIQTTASS